MAPLMGAQASSMQQANQMIGCGGSHERVLVNSCDGGPMHRRNPISKPLLEDQSGCNEISTHCTLCRKPVGSTSGFVT